MLRSRRDDVFDSGCSASAKCRFANAKVRVRSLQFVNAFYLEFRERAVRISGPFSGPHFRTVLNPKEVVLQVGVWRITRLVRALAVPNQGLDNGPSLRTAEDRLFFARLAICLRREFWASAVTSGTPAGVACARGRQGTRRLLGRRRDDRGVVSSERECLQRRRRRLPAARCIRRRGALATSMLTRGAQALRFQRQPNCWCPGSASACPDRIPVPKGGPQSWRETQPCFCSQAEGQEAKRSLGFSWDWSGRVRSPLVFGAR